MQAPGGRRVVRGRHQLPDLLSVVLVHGDKHAGAADQQLPLAGEETEGGLDAIGASRRA